MSKDTGGPAFPFAATDNSNVEMQAQGMTLRDYFAAKAMIAGISGSRWEIKDSDLYAGWCYTMADAMLREREK